MSARTMTESTPFEHKVTPRYTEFQMPPELAEVTIQDVYGALVNDALRTRLRDWHALMWSRTKSLGVCRG
jgi:hypothetical protein